MVARGWLSWSWGAGAGAGARAGARAGGGPGDGSHGSWGWLSWSSGGGFRGRLGEGGHPTTHPNACRINRGTEKSQKS